MVSSDELLWTDFQRQLDKACNHVEAVWRRTRFVAPALYVWHDKAIKDVEGHSIDGVVTHLLNPAQSQAPAQFADKVHKSHPAFAMLLVNRVGDSLVLSVETTFSAKTVTFPILLSADIEVLGEKKTSTETHILGVLWRSKRQVS